MPMISFQNVLNPWSSIDCFHVICMPHYLIWFISHCSYCANRSSGVDFPVDLDVAVSCCLALFESRITFTGHARSRSVETVTERPLSDLNPSIINPRKRRFCSPIVDHQVVTPKCSCLASRPFKSIMVAFPAACNALASILIISTCLS